MESLKDFIAKQAEKLRTEEPRLVKKRDEWTAAVDRLNHRIVEWLAQADPHQEIIKVSERIYQLREERIGTYQVSGLTVALGPREVRIEPIARNVVGPLAATGVVSVNRAYGRVDLTDGLKKYMLFRVEKEPEDRWNIIEQDGFRIQPFDQTAFEEAFKSLLE